MKLKLAIIAVFLITLNLIFAQEAATPPPPEPTVETMVFCTSIEDRVPVGVDTVFAPPVNKVFCHVKVKNGAHLGEVYMVWFLDGAEKARVQLKIGADSWRTYSSKTIPPEWDGNWKVEIQTPEGKAIRTESFVFAKQ